MKRLFTIFFALLLGITAAFAQTQPTLPYQAVVRDNQNHLLKDADVSIDVQIYEGTTWRYSETQTPHSNANGLISFNIGAGSDATGTMADVADWRVAKFKFTYHLTDGDVVVTDSVHAVPYALQTAFATGGNFLTSDSAVITTMQGNITTNTTNIATNTTDIAALANRVNTFNTNVCDSVKNCDFSSNSSIQSMLQELSDLISAQNHKIDSLARIVDSLSNLTPGGGDEPATFTCGTDKVQDTDGNEYNTVQIGEQCWMAENMRATQGRDGSISSGSSTSKDTPYRYCPDDKSANVSKYGYLYNWEAAMKVCPEGWHLPSKEEFQTLMDYCSNNYAAGDDRENNAKALAASTTNWNSSSSSYDIGKNPSANNQSGFSALPAGIYNGTYYGIGNNAYFWSSTPHGESNAYSLTLSYNDSKAHLSDYIRSLGWSVRCLRDAGVGGDTPGGDEPTPCTPTSSTHNIEISISELPYTFGTDTTFSEGTTAGTYTLHRTNVGGCDSTITIHLSFFTCGTDKVMDVDNNEYNTVAIGNQCWMKENMKTTKYANNTAINSSKMFNPDNNQNNVAIYGKLYTWSAATRDSSTTYPAEGQVKVQGICPTGWHVPSQAEFGTLTNYVKGKNDCKCSGEIANALSSPTGWNNRNNTGCNAGDNSTTRNKTDFSAVPPGYYYVSDHTGYDEFGDCTYFWSATQSASNAAYSLYLTKNSDVATNNSKIGKGWGVSVRCLKD